MKKRLLLFMLVAALATLFLLPNFYRNRWGVVETVRYEDWQARYDRLVIARLVKTRQEGFFSASGLLGLGDVKEWNYLNRTNRRQFNAYLNGDNFRTYFVYKSNPGFQGALYGIFDQVLFFNQSTKLKLFRGFTALASALVFGVIVAVSIREFGWLSGILILLFAAFSEWTILPAGTIFYNFWSFYLPPLLTTYLLAEAENKNNFESKKIYSVIFITVLMKIVLSGFDFVTTVLVMTTVPFIFFGIYYKWSWKLLFERLIKTGLVLLAATLTGLLILSLQIVTSTGDLESAGSHIFDRLAIYTIENPAIFEEVDAGAKASTLAVTARYFIIPALVIHFQIATVQILYWHLVLVFFTFSIVLFLRYRLIDRVFPNRGIALVVATWYSLLAPLSWFVIFKKHSFIHTHVNPIVWQMPFTLLGLALCGFVITELFKRKDVEDNRSGM